MEFNNKKELDNYHSKNYDLWRENIKSLKEFDNQRVKLYPTWEANISGRVWIALPASEAKDKAKYNLI